MFRECRYSLIRIWKMFGKPLCQDSYHFSDVIFVTGVILDVIYNSRNKWFLILHVSPGDKNQLLCWYYFCSARHAQSVFITYTNPSSFHFILIAEVELRLSREKLRAMRCGQFCTVYWHHKRLCKNTRHKTFPFVLCFGTQSHETPIICMQGTVA